MSAKILQSMSEEDSAAHRHIGCMNGLFHLFDRHHFLQGRRLNGHHKRFSAGQKGSLDTSSQANEASHISMMKNPKPVIEKQRLSTDSSRSSVSSSCNSSSFFSSNMEDTKIAHQIPERPPCSSPSEISKLVRDSILHSHRDVRGITVKAGSKEESRALKYVDSPRPSLPSPKATTTNPKRLSGFRESLGALPAFHKLKNTESGIDRSSSLLRKESPRYSYDGRESRPAAKINKELLPRYSLDSKRPNCPHQLDPVVVPYQEPGSHRRQSSLVAKLMGLEDLEEPVKDPKPTSRNLRIIPVESAPWKRQEQEQTQCLASEGNSSSVYGEMEKRLAQLEFGKSGKDLRALKHILQSMQKGGTETETCSTPCSPTIKKTCSPKNTRTLKPTTKKTETAKVSVSTVVPVPALRKLDLGDKKPRAKKFPETAKKNQHSPRKIPATSQKKKPNLLDSPRSKNNSSVRKTKNSASSQKSRSQWEQGSELSGDSRELSEQNNGISLQSDGGISMSSSQEEVEVTSKYRPKKMELVREEGLVGKRLICTVEQPSPVSVLDPRIYEDESPSPVRMISTAFEDVEALNYDEPQWRPVELKFPSQNNKPTPSPDATNISFIDTNPNHRYISQILFASNLFKHLDSASSIIHLQQSSNRMTENTFLTLQETNTKGKELLERRLIFDVVNEILGRKLESYDRVSPNYKFETKQQVLKGLCMEIDELPCKLDEEDDDCFGTMVEKDLNRDSVGWTGGSCDSSRVAVDIERMIFRDLISEVVMGTDVRGVGSGYRRQLF